MSWNDAYVSVGGIMNGSVFSVQRFPFENRALAYNDTVWAHSHEVDGEPGVLRVSIPYTAYGGASIQKTLLAVFPQYDPDTGDIIQYLRVYYAYTNRVSFGKPEVAVEVWLAGYNDVSGEFAIGDSRESITTAPGYVDYMFDLYLYLCGGEVPGESFKCYGVGIGAYSQTLDKYSWGYVLTTDSRLQLGYIPEIEDFSPEFGPASDFEGYDPQGGFDDSSDEITIPSKPQSVLSLGFVKVYKCDAGSLAQFGAELFPEIQFPTSLTEVGEVLAAVSDSIWNSKLIDYVISVHCVPGDVTAGNPTDIKVGARTMTGIQGKPITNEYVDFDFGSITLDKYYKNYADYMTEIQLYLPFYGFVSLRPEEVIDGKIQVNYRFNVIDGSFTAFVLSTSSRSKLKDSLIGQYGGSCIVHLPVSNLSYASMFSSLIGSGAGAAMGIASGGAGAAVAASLAASNGVINAAQGGDVKKNNSYNASSSFMARRKPFLIVTRPVSSFSTRYNIENGLPSNVSMTIGSCNGFTQVDAPIINFACTDEEQREIIAALKEGVII